VGIGLGKEDAEKLVGKLLGQDKAQRKKNKHNPYVVEPESESDYEEGDYQDRRGSKVVMRWRTVQTLIIDEISMIDGVLFDKLEFIARKLRKNPQPFGGIQLILTGDFLQLPPVPDHAANTRREASFAFEAKTWNNCVGDPIILTKVFRQKDQAFVDMLNEMRYGRLDTATINTFRTLSRIVTYEDGIEPTDLFPTRNEVDSANERRLREIKSTAHVYASVDIPGYDDKHFKITMQTMERLLDRLVAPKSITLKVGAQVMLIKNMEQGFLVNGSLGKVVAFSTPREALQNGTQIAMMENESRDDRKGKKKPEDCIPKHLVNSVWPVVSFENGKTMLCIPCPFEVNNADGGVEAVRHQIPLILAWALSIHKSQGQTISRVRVNLNSTFEKGQAYVALSRATTLECLEVRGFDPLKVVAHPRVLEWMAKYADGHIPRSIEDDLEFWDDLQ